MIRVTAHLRKNLFDITTSLIIVILKSTNHILPMSC